MSFKFLTDEWIKELSSLLNQSESYLRSAKDWEGDFIFVVEPDEACDELVYYHLELFHGKSPGAGLVQVVPGRSGHNGGGNLGKH